MSLKLQRGFRICTAKHRLYDTAEPQRETKVFGTPAHGSHKPAQNAHSSATSDMIADRIHNASVHMHLINSHIASLSSLH